MTGSTATRYRSMPAMLACSLPLVLLFGSFWFYGAFLATPALVLCILASAGLALIAVKPSIRDDWAQLHDLAPAAVLFGAVLAVAAISLTPLAPGGVHPVWEMAGAQGAATINKAGTQLEMVKLCGLACFFAIGCLLASTPERCARAIRVLLGLGAIHGIVALLVFTTHPTQHRLLAGFYTPNTAGTLFGLLLILSVSETVERFRRSERERLSARMTALAPAAGLNLLFLGCLLLTASRGAMAATLVAMIAFLVAGSIQHRRSLLGLVLFSITAIVVASLFVGAGNSLFADRFADAQTDGQARAALLGTHWQAFIASPLMGYGLGSFSKLNSQLITSENYAVLSETVVLHNTYVQWLEEAGVIGAAPMFLCIAWLVGTTIRNLARRRNRTRTLGLLCGIVMVLFHASVDVSLQTFGFTALWALLLGLAFASAQAKSGRSKPRTGQRPKQQNRLADRDSPTAVQRDNFAAQHS